MRLLGNQADAEDATQATFIVLARKCGAVSGPLVPWLLGVSRRVAHDFLLARVRRQQREQKVAKAGLTGEDAAMALRDELDAALAQLPPKLAEAVSLRYLEGRSQQEAAEISGCPQGTLGRRAMDGLNRLRVILSRRGVVVAPALLVSFLVQEKAVAMSATLAGKLTLGGMMAVAGASSKASVMAGTVMKAMFWAKVKIYALVTAGATVAAAAVAAPIILIPASEKPKPQPVAAVNPVQLGINASLGGKRPFPDDNPWNQDVSREPVDPNSAALINKLGADLPLFPDFGTPLPGRSFSYVVVGGEQPQLPVKFDWKDESDNRPYPIPDNLPIDPAQESHRGIVIDRDHWMLYELGTPIRRGANWQADVGAVWDMKTNQVRPLGWTSTDGAGLPVFPGLIRHDEVREQKAIRHALRFSASRIRSACIAPARHYAKGNPDPSLPPMGMRVRLRADFDISGFPPDAQVILTALKTYGMFLAESGTSWYLQGVPDQRWNDQALKTLMRVKGRDFEVVKMGNVEIKQ
jgi:RNA polymerase sigma factor (sigma-70 family)